MSLANKFSAWPSILSQMIDGAGKIFDNYETVPFPKAEEEALVRRLLEEKERLRPHINAELQYATKQRLSFLDFELVVKELQEFLNKEIASKSKG